MIQNIDLNEKEKRKKKYIYIYIYIKLNKIISITDCTSSSCKTCASDICSECLATYYLYEGLTCSL